MIVHYDPKKYFLPIRTNNQGLKMSMFGGMPVSARMIGSAKYVYKNKLVFTVNGRGSLLSTLIPVKKEITNDRILEIKSEDDLANHFGEYQQYSIALQIQNILSVFSIDQSVVFSENRTFVYFKHNCKTNSNDLVAAITYFANGAGYGSCVGHNHIAKLYKLKQYCESLGLAVPTFKY